MKKYKVLFLMQLPPPIHGASAVNSSIKKSATINQEFNTFYFNISPAKSLSDIGKLSLSKAFSFVKILLTSLYLYTKLKPDLVYMTLSPHGLAFYKDGLIAILLKAMGGHLVFHLHGKGIKNQAQKSRIKTKIYEIIFKDVDIIHLSEKLFVDVENIRDKSKSIFAISNGIDNSDYTLPLPKNEVITFVYLSNLIRAKGADILIRASALVSKNQSMKFKVKIIGSQSSIDYYNELNSLITPELSQTVSILGPKYGKEKAEELCTSHIFVLPTQNDCFPLSILEAMAAGLAVISTNQGAIPDIVDHGVTGDVIDSVTPEALADAMIKHINNRQYSEACSNSGNKKFLSKYTQAIFEKNLALNIKLIAERNSSL